MQKFTVLLLAVFVASFGWLQQYSPAIYDGEVRMYEDRDGRFDIANAVNLPWQAQPLSPVNLGFRDSFVWFYIPLPSTLFGGSVSRVLEIDFPTIDRLEFYRVNAQGEVVQRYLTGTDLPFASRPFWDDDWVFPLESVQPGDRLFLRAATSNSLQMPIRFYEYDDFLRQDMLGLMCWGGMYGLLLIMAMYSFLNGLVIRDRMYIFYGGYVMASGLTSAALNGHGFAYLWPDAPAVNAVSLSVFPPLVICFGVAFALEYLDFVRGRAKERWLGYLLIAAAFLTAVTSWLTELDLSFWAAVEIFVFSVVMFAFGVKAIRRGHYLGWYFLVGWSVFLVGASMFALNVLGLLPFNIITVHSKEVGSAFEIIMLSLGMSAIYSHEKEERSRIDSAIDAMNQRLRRRLNLINSKNGVLEIPQLSSHLQDIRNLDRRIHDEMGRLLVVAVQVIDRVVGRPDYIAQGDCLRGLFNSRVTVFPFNTTREGLQGEVTVLLFPLHNKFEAEPILERVEQWRQSLGEQYDLHFGYAISHLTEKYDVDYIDESLHYLEEAIARHAVSYSIDDTLGFAARQQTA
ncbi:MAG: 7TM diverse intracellular signaling domain-containing protein [Gammaproteobacteria bacterium]